MSSLTIRPSYIPLETKAKWPVPRIGGSSNAAEKLALVIPTLREVISLRCLLAQVRSVLDSTAIDYEIVVVDDDSRDGTDEVVSAIAQDDPRVRLLVRSDERGLSGAILHGWQSSDATILGVMDADLQHPPQLLPALLSAVLNGCDLAIGSRYAKGGSLGEWNPIRRLMSAAAVWMARPLQRPWLRAKDPMSGFFIVRRPCLQNVLFRPTGFKLLLEILASGHIHSVQEVPFSFGSRAAGRSKVNLKVAWEYLLLLLKLYSARIVSSRVPQEASGD